MRAIYGRMAADAPGVVTCIAKHLEIPYFCYECKIYFSVKIGTVMEHTKISCRRWAVAIYLLATRPRGYLAYSWVEILA